jgi:Lon protease-like protein
MGDHVKLPDTAVSSAGLDAHRDARAVVRLVQCLRCSYPLKLPVTLPCGYSVCRNCLPQPRIRENISYPNRPDRQQGFTCPFVNCRKEHSLDDFSLDVTLTKIVGVIGNELSRFRSASNSPILVGEKSVNWSPGQNAWSGYEKHRSKVLNGGRLSATYTLAEMGELKHDADATYQSMSETGDDYRSLDIEALEKLKAAARSELDCQVCYALILDPLTTSCGHTFCRKCLVRVLDHSNNCPICRRALTVPPSLSLEPSNKRLTEIITGLCPQLLVARAEQASREDAGTIGELDTPLFVCTLSYPTMPTFLHIFEARYRLMIRRVVESGSMVFGMLMYNQSGEPQGDLGQVQFMQYGTLLRIRSVQTLPDGRSLVETTGVSRFKVTAWGVLDGYTIGSISRVEDISLAEEERLEALETTAPASPTSNDPVGQLDRLSTRALLQVCTGYVNQMRVNSAPWLHDRILTAYGAPPEDPALFPYWFASVLPIADEEKYRLLRTTSVRERLKITARWVRRLEQRW